MTAAMIDIREQGRSADYSIMSLKKMLVQLIGEPFQFARFSYGDELTIHFGGLKDARHSKLREKGIKYGTYIVRARGSGWLLKSGPEGKIVFDKVEEDLDQKVLESCTTRITEKEIEGGNFLAQGTFVLRVLTCHVHKTDGEGLRIDMSDDSSVFIIPTVDENIEDLPIISDWELITPHGIIKVGPGQKWDWEERPIDQSSPQTNPIS